MMYEENEDCRKKNIERRRETSRFAARDRRGKEADIFSDLKDEVPIVHDATVTHVDRIALLRVAATFCRLRKCGAEVLRTRLCRENTNGIWGEDALLECLDGFILLADSDGTILYVSESVALYLGLTQTDLTGRNLREFMHPSDFDEFAKLNDEMKAKATGNEDRGMMGENIVLRMKTVISPRGRNLNLKGALFKPISCLLRVMHSDGNSISLIQGCTVPAGQGSISATANAITKNGESPNGTFMTRHTCDMRISYVSDTFNFILKNDARSLMGCSFYELVHPADAHIVHKSIRELFQKGHVRTPFYRLVAANNNLAWVMTEATTINHTTRGQKGQYVICIHYVLGIQGESESLVMCSDSQPAGMPVLKTIKAEMDCQEGEDIVGKELVGRQPAILECFDFTPLVAPSDEIMIGSPPQITQNNGRATRNPSPESRKTSYDAVLQWLFRDRPSSPAPRYREGHDGRATLSPGHHSFAANPGPPSKRSRREVDYPSPSGPHSVPAPITAIRPRTDSFGGGSSRESNTKESPTGVPRGSAQPSHSGYSPLAEGLADCALRSPIDPLSPKHTRIMGENQLQMGRPIGGGSNGIDATAHRSRGLPAVSSNGTHPLLASHSRGSMFPTLSPSTSFHQTIPTTSSNHQQFINGDQRKEAILQERADAVNKALADLDFPFEDLHSIAPFVPQEELQPISESVAKELQTLFPDLPDWTPTEPVSSAGRMAKLGEDEDEDRQNGDRPSSKGVFHPSPPIASPPSLPSIPSSSSPSSSVFQSQPSHSTHSSHHFIPQSPQILRSPSDSQNGVFPAQNGASMFFNGLPHFPANPQQNQSNWPPHQTTLIAQNMQSIPQHRFPQNPTQIPKQWANNSQIVHRI